MVYVGSSWVELDYWTSPSWGGYDARLRVLARSTQDIATNTSTVYFKLQKRVTGGSAYNYDPLDFEITCTDAVGGGHSATQTWTFGSVSSTSWEDVGGDDSDMYWSSVDHRADGTLTMTANAEGDRVLGGTFDTDITIQLPTIARASKPTGSPNPLTIGSSGATLTINTNRKSSSFMHTVKVQCGSWSWTSSARAVGASVNVTIPYTVIALFSATSKTATATVTCTTFSGTTQIGSAQTCSVTFQINTSVDHPNVGTITISDTNTTTHNVVQDNTKYVAYKSTLTASIPLTVSGSYTQLASATVTCGTKTQNYTLSGTSQTITFTFANVNANKLTVTVKDKRGTSASGSKTWTLLSYSPLTMTATVGRTSATGSTATGKVTGNAYGGTFGASTNSLTISYQWKLHSASSWTSGANTYTQSLSSGVSAYTKNITFSESFDYTQQYDIKFTVKDLFTTVTYTCQLMQGLPIISWDETEVDVYGNLDVHYRTSPEYYWTVPNSLDMMLNYDGRKNLLQNTSNTQTISGITFTVTKANGKVTVNGTATAQAQFYIYFTWKHGTQNCYFSGCPSGGGSSSYDVYIWDRAASARAKKWDGSTASASCSGDALSDSQEVRLENGKEYIYVIRVYSGVTISNQVFEPMIRNYRIASNGFVPFAPPTSGRRIMRVEKFTSGTVTVNANSATSTTVNFTTLNGYSPLAILRTWTNGSVLVSYSPTNSAYDLTSCTVWLRNVTSSSANVTVSVEVLYVRDEYTI